MILAAGLTPAWQQILLFDRFEPGQVNRACEAHWCASGKVLNVGIALHHLARSPADCKTLALVGGRSGEAIRNEFARLGINARWVETATPTRVCTTILDSHSGRTTELVENSAPPTAAELDAFVAAYLEEAAAADLVILSGSLPQGTPDTFYRRLLECTPGRAILDIRGNELLHALAQRPFLVKPNREELARTAGRRRMDFQSVHADRPEVHPTVVADALDLNDEPSLIAAMHELNDLGAGWTVVSHGKEAVYVTSQQAAYRIEPPTIDVVNPIACGDCFAAGIAWATQNGREPLEAIRIGMAAAADNLRQLLPARLDPAWIERTAATIQMLPL